MTSDIYMLILNLIEGMFCLLFRVGLNFSIKYASDYSFQLQLNYISGNTFEANISIHNTLVVFYLPENYENIILDHVSLI